jgi:gluconate kinase
VIIWLNGTFGAGKTTTAKELTALLPEARLFDAEQVGYMLRHVLDSVPVKNFQDWPPWRSLVVETAAQVLDYLGGTLVVVQSVLVEEYWAEIRDGLRRAGIPVHHFVLHADREVMVRRIEADDSLESGGARQWRLDHLAAYEGARAWLGREGEVVDTTRVGAPEAARLIASRVS